MRSTPSCRRAAEYSLPRAPSPKMTLRICLICDLNPFYYIKLLYTPLEFVAAILFTSYNRTI
ncbi:hypothetical protein NSMM_900006 [Nitrosomonas mobilis]|uniref:Uncharacterized protein n=1 Tax=Nitrosomonas mobilis TaxID=51642 RepID=A0A1G5SJH3_9PROT|nr:hypothetical protein NSMM_900006 [Nitrosomonas mobilis]